MVSHGMAKNGHAGAKLGANGHRDEEQTGMDGIKAQEAALKQAMGLRSPERFVGRYRNKVDGKGRVSVPADLRRYVDLDGAEPSPVLYCFPSLIAPELHCGGPDLVKLILWTVESLDIFGGDHFAREAFVTGETRRLYFDDNGRVVLPKDLREHAKLGTEVDFQGRGAFFAIAAPVATETLRAAGMQVSAEDIEAMKARMLPSTMSKARFD